MTQPRMAVARQGAEALPAVLDPANDAALSPFADHREEHARSAEVAKHNVQRAPSEYLRLPFPALNALVGPIPPGSFIVWPGMSGHGKTTALMSIFDELTDAGEKVLYCGLEIPDADLKIHWACRRLARRNVFIHPGDALTGRLHPDSPERVHGHADKLAALLAEIDAIGNGVGEFGRIAPVKWLTAKGARKILEWAWAHGFKLVIIDHLDHIWSDGQSDGFREMREILQVIKNGCQELGVTVFGASQMTTEIQKLDVIRAHQPPTVSSVMFGMLKRSISDGMIAVRKPLLPFPDVNGPDGVKLQAMYLEAMKIARVKGDATELVIPNVMAFDYLKDRPYGKEGGKAVAYVGVDHGRVVEADPAALERARRYFLDRLADEDGGGVDDFVPKSKSATKQAAKPVGVVPVDVPAVPDYSDTEDYF